MKDSTDTPTTFQFNGSQPFPWADGRRLENISGIPNFFSKPVFGQTADILAAARFLVVAAVVSSILRIFSRRRTKSKFLWDDVCAVAATVFLVAYTMIFVEFNYLGRISFSFFAESSPEDERERQANIVLGLKLSLASEVLYLTGMFLVRFSMLFLYDRFARQTRGIILYLRITQCLCAATLVACILALFLSCRPVSNYWTLTQKDEQCSRRTLLTYTSGISNIVTNTLVLAVPVPLLLRATLTRHQKIGLWILYLFGAAVILASVLHFVTQLLNVSLPQTMGWSQMELSLALLLACAPMAVKLFLIPLVDQKTEQERILSSKKCDCITPALRTAGLDTPTFMKKLMDERDAMITANSPLRDMAESSGGLSNGPRRVSFSVDSTGRSRGLGASNSAGAAEEGRSVREVNNPDRHKLRLVRGEVDGQSVWEVRPLTPRIAV